MPKTRDRARRDVVISTEAIRFAFSAAAAERRHGMAGWNLKRAAHANFHRESVALAIEGEPYYRVPGRKRAGDYRNQKRVVKVIKQLVTKSFSVTLGPPRRPKAPRVSCPRKDHSEPREDGRPPIFPSAALRIDDYRKPGAIAATVSSGERAG